MKRCFEEYCANVNEVNCLVKHNITDGMTPDDIVRMILSGSERIYELKSKNDAFLQDTIYSRHAEELADDDVKPLFEFAEFLFRNGSFDIGISYKVHCMLYDYALYSKNKDMEIRELYYMGLTLNALHILSIGNNINTCGQKIHDYFCKGAEYMKDYESFESEETRAFIIRCLGNKKYGSPIIKGNGDWRSPTVTTKGYKYYSEIFDDAMRVIHSEYYRRLNPELPWGIYEYSMHYDRTVYLSNLRMALSENKITPEYKKMADDVLESAEFVYRRQDELASKKFHPVGARTIYVHAAAMFHAGKLTARELVDTILKSMENADVNDYSQNGMDANIGLATYAHHYMNYLSPEDKKELNPRFEAAINHSREYIRNCPDTSIGEKLGLWISELMKKQIVYDKSFRASAMQYLLYCHPPTYVHSYMVAFLSKTIFLEMLKTEPEALCGIFGIESVEQLYENSDALADRAFFCGLYHDVGKNQVIPYISVYSRKLLDEEFEAIKYHTVLGYFTLAQYPDLDVEAEVALRHHRRYDNKGGYPDLCDEPPSEKSKAIIDIVTVADSLDAATDNIGRSYSLAKTVYRLAEELREGSGTRYSPDVVKIFNNEEFLERLKSEMDSYRKKVYCDAYSLIKWDTDIYE